MLDKSSIIYYIAFRKFKAIVMNKLSLEKRTQIIGLLVEGNSLRAASRLADVSINTVTKLLVDVGTVCQKYHDENVHDVKSKLVQYDEIWSFIYAKKKSAWR